MNRRLLIHRCAATASVGILGVAGLAYAPANASQPAAPTSSFTAQVWADNWFALHVNGKKVGQDSVPITTERSFNAETITFTATYPLTIGIMAKDFTENASGLEYIGTNRQHLAKLPVAAPLCGRASRWHVVHVGPVLCHRVLARRDVVEEFRVVDGGRRERRERFDVRPSRVRGAVHGRYSWNIEPAPALVGALQTDGRVQWAVGCREDPPQRNVRLVHNRKARALADP